MHALVLTFAVRQEAKASAKRKSLMLKALKVLKASRNGDNHLVSIPEAVCMVASGMKVSPLPLCTFAVEIKLSWTLIEN